MKHQSGKDMIIFGSGVIVSLFAELGLIDQYLVMISPVILGNGNLLFKGIHERLKLQLIRLEIFDSGNLLLSYEPYKTLV